VVSPVWSIDLRIDITGAAGLGEPASIAVTATAADAVLPHPVVCFAKPGAGYGRGYCSGGLLSHSALAAPSAAALP
jgi:hypothetical protein